MTAFDLPDFSSGIYPQGQLVLTEQISQQFNYQSPVFYCGDSLSLILLTSGAGTSSGQAALITYYADPLGSIEIVQFPNSSGSLLTGQVGIPVCGPYFRLTASISTDLGAESLFMQVFKSAQPLTHEVSYWTNPLLVVDNGSMGSGNNVVSFLALHPGPVWMTWALTANPEVLQILDTTNRLAVYDAGALAATIPARGNALFYCPPRMCELSLTLSAATGVFIEGVPAYGS